METRPSEEERLQVGSFAAHSTRGVIRDPRMRRKAMLALLLLAVVMVIGGASVLRDFLNPREHGIRFILFWLACAWFTVTALLLALFDMLMVRADARKKESGLRKRIDGAPRDTSGEDI
jgi:hypothetical protein